jgi:sugar lactone lactonase YvrE
LTSPSAIEENLVSTMPGAFLSYRRTDAGGHARRLYERLRGHFGDRVFKDTDSLPAGEDFEVALRAALDDCDALIAVIGAGWAEAADATGRRRLDDPSDWVRTEIATGLERGVEVTPVVLPGAAMPTVNDLPAELRPLASRPAFVLRADRWAEDVDALIARLQAAGVARWLTPISAANAHRLRVRHELHGHTAGVSAVAFSPDGFLLATAGGAPSPASFGRLSDADDVESLGDTSVRVWRVADGSAVRAFSGGGWACAVAVSPDGETVLSGDQETVLAWGLADGRRLRELSAEGAVGTSVAFAPDGARIAAGAKSGAIVSWSWPGGVPRLWGRQGKPVMTVAFSPDGGRLASGGSDGVLRLWEDGAGEPVAKLLTGSPLVRSRRGVRAIAFDRTGARVAAGCQDGAVRVWRVEDRALTATLRHPDGWVNCVAFSPDGSLLAAGGGEGVLRLWPLRGGAPVDLPGVRAAVNDVAFSRDGATLAAGMWNATSVLWRVRDERADPA